MKVKLLVSRGGISGTQRVGDIIDVSDAEGLRMIKKNHAIAFNQNKKERTSKKQVKETRA